MWGTPSVPKALLLIFLLLPPAIPIRCYTDLEATQVLEPSNDDIKFVKKQTGGFDIQCHNRYFFGSTYPQAIVSVRGNSNLATMLYPPSVSVQDPLSTYIPNFVTRQYLGSITVYISGFFCPLLSVRLRPLVLLTLLTLGGQKVELGIFFSQLKQVRQASVKVCFALEIVLKSHIRAPFQKFDIFSVNCG